MRQEKSFLSFFLEILEMMQSGELRLGGGRIELSSW